MALKTGDVLIKTVDETKSLASGPSPTARIRSPSELSSKRGLESARFLFPSVGFIVNESKLPDLTGAEVAESVDVGYIFRVWCVDFTATGALTVFHDVRSDGTLQITSGLDLVQMTVLRRARMLK